MREDKVQDKWGTGLLSAAIATMVMKLQDT